MAILAIGKGLRRNGTSIEYFKNFETEVLAQFNDYQLPVINLEKETQKRPESEVLASSAWPVTGCWGGSYEPVPIEEPVPGRYRGYSEVLRLYVCWEDTRLEWYDPVEGVYLPDYDSILEARATSDAARLSAEARADQAEARIRQLEAENQRLRNL